MKTVPKKKEGKEIFYSDILARSLLRAGVPKYDAYQIAHHVWEEISHTRKKIDISKKVSAILKKKYPESLPRYRVWRKIMKKSKPLILLIAGGTGIGTSTLALRLAWLLEIQRIVSTDSVREVIRQFMPKNILPVLHVSTYQSDEVIEQVKSEHDRLIYGFVTQSKEVLNGVEAIIKRAITEKTSIVMEGVHLIPGEMTFLEQYKNKATIIEVMLDVDQRSKHMKRFFSRHLENATRGKTKYLKHFKEIRMIRDYLVKQAIKSHVPVIENYDLRKVEKAILEKIYEHNVEKNNHLRV